MMGTRLGKSTTPGSPRFLPPSPTSLGDQLATFVRDGFLVLEIPDSEVPASVHQAIRTRSAQLDFGSFGNNIFPEIQELEQVITSKTLSKALEAVLGPDYRLNRHRWLHVSSSQGDQDWHKDSYFGARRMRSHRTRWVMAMYYPQDTVLEMGPTAVLPGSQYVTVDHEDEGEHGEDLITGKFRRKASELDKARLERAEAVQLLDPCLQEQFVTVKAGSIALIHYDLIHRGTPDSRGARARSSEPRCMFKLQFYRVHEPQPVFPIPLTKIDGMDHMKPVHQAMLHWLGAPETDIIPNMPSAGDLLSDSESKRIAVAYSFGTVARHAREPNVREDALGSLAGAMCHEREDVRRAASFGFATAGPEGVKHLLEILQTKKAPEAAHKYIFWSLGEAGVASEEVLQTFSKALESKAKDWSYTATLEKSTAVAALGLLGAQAAQEDAALFSRTCQMLIAAARDKTEPAERSMPGENGKFLVRESAALALLLVCAAAPEKAAAQDDLVDLLADLVDDEDRYALGFAAEALRSLAVGGSAKATQVLCEVFGVKAESTPITDFARLVRCQKCPRTSERDPI